MLRVFDNTFWGLAFLAAVGGSYCNRASSLRRAFAGLGTGILSKEYAQDLKALDATAIYPCSLPNQTAGIFAGRADQFVLSMSTNKPYFICDGLPLFSVGGDTTGTNSTGDGTALNPSSNKNVHQDYPSQGTNGAALQAAWPYFFKPGTVNTTIPYSEFFAEAFNASVTGGELQCS